MMCFVEELLSSCCLWIFMFAYLTESRPFIVVSQSDNCTSLFLVLLSWGSFYPDRTIILFAIKVCWSRLFQANRIQKSCLFKTSILALKLTCSNLVKTGHLPTLETWSSIDVISENFKFNKSTFNCTWKTSKHRNIRMHFRSHTLMINEMWKNSKYIKKTVIKI